MKIESTPQEEKQFQNNNKIKARLVVWELFKKASPIKTSK
jgi:hypothetical protein